MGRKGQKGAARSLNADQEQEVTRRYVAGDPVTAIGTYFGIYTSTVTRIALRHGAERRGKPKTYLSAAEQADVLARYEAGERSLDIAAQFNVDTVTVTAIVRRLGGNVRPLGRPWQGKPYITDDGYRVLTPEPVDDITRVMINDEGRVLEHRLVMALSMGRPLHPQETVHHINGDRADNRLENLQLRQGRHGNGVVLRCVNCGSCNIAAQPIADAEE